MKTILIILTLLSSVSSFAQRHTTKEIAAAVQAMIALGHQTGPDGCSVTFKKTMKGRNENYQVILVDPYQDKAVFEINTMENFILSRIAASWIDLASSSPDGDTALLSIKKNRFGLKVFINPYAGGKYDCHIP